MKFQQNVIAIYTKYTIPRCSAHQTKLLENPLVNTHSYKEEAHKDTKLRQVWQGSIICNMVMTKIATKRILLCYIRTTWEHEISYCTKKKITSI